MATKTRKETTVGVRPLHNKILVERDEAEGRTVSGIYLPESSKDRPKTGTVKAVGDGSLNTETGQRIPLTVKAGDRVIFSSYAGTEIKLEGEELLIMKEEDILAIID
ncbi:MAG: co-chaperone GroES [Leptolyngbya sp. PLA3]|nr:MAG: co-chaperone GroES [Cyanobacteria bacterium CYA]MCE7968449.1 co-chaperone GroES [Leptolyngbya sp. PL-A3]